MWEASLFLQQCSVVNAANFLQNPHRRHPIARPLGRGMGCLLCVQTLICILPQSLQWCIQNCVIFDHVMTARDSMRKNNFTREVYFFCKFMRKCQRTICIAMQRNIASPYIFFWIHHRIAYNFQTNGAYKYHWFIYSINNGMLEDKMLSYCETTERENCRVWKLLRKNVVILISLRAVIVPKPKRLIN